MERQHSEVPAVESSIRILEYLSRYKHRKSSLADIAKDLSINKSTCHRILKVLGDYHFVFFEQDTKQYSLGSHLVVLGSRALEFTNYLDITKSVLKWLCAETNQTCVLLEPISDLKLMYVAKEEPNLPIRVTVNIGQYFPLTSASFGKCYLGFLEESEAEKCIQTIGLKQFTSKSITNLDDFKAELAKVRKQGYAKSYEEHTLGVYGISAPVFDAHRNVAMVVSTVGLSQQADPNFIDYCAGRVVEAAQRITRFTGGRIPQNFKGVVC